MTSKGVQKNHQVIRTPAEIEDDYDAEDESDSAVSFVRSCLEDGLQDSYVAKTHDQKGAEKKAVLFVRNG